MIVFYAKKRNKTLVFLADVAILEVVNFPVFSTSCDSPLTFCCQFFISSTCILDPRLSFFGNILHDGFLVVINAKPLYLQSKYKGTNGMIMSQPMLFFM
jgi:hypothetical protein